MHDLPATSVKNEPVQLLGIVKLNLRLGEFTLFHLHDESITQVYLLLRNLRFLEI